MTVAGAARRDRHGRDVTGVLLLDKPAGVTSHAALRAAQRLYGATKAGHTGTLDPLATGLLPACFGDATRFAHVLLDAEKTYLATVRLGVTTTTGDLEGEVTCRAPVAVTSRDVAAVLQRFVGEIMQVPPMYSAIKRDGQPLYKLARAGHEVTRTPRKVTVRELALLELAGQDLQLRVVCSKGTYVRVLAEDIGRSLGCGACLSALRRTGVGDFAVGRPAHSLGELQDMTPEQRDAILLPADALLASLPRLDLDAEQARRVMQGQAVGRPATGFAGLVRLYGPARDFLGLGEVLLPERVVPRRLISKSSPAGAGGELLLEKTRS